MSHEHHQRHDPANIVLPKPSLTETKNIPKKSKKTLKIMLLLGVLSVFGLYGFSFVRLQSTEKFIYIDQLDGNLAQKTVTKLSFIHDFLWEQKKITEGFPLKAQAIKDFSPIVTQKKTDKKFVSNLSDFWNNTSALKSNNNIYPEKIIFSLTHETNDNKLFQRMTYWDDAGNHYSAEINEQYGHVVTQIPETYPLPAKIQTLPIDRIILNVSETSQRIKGLKHIILEYKTDTNSYDVTLIDKHEEMQAFYVDDRGLIKRK